MNEATRKALIEWTRIMDAAVVGHAKELARAEWERAGEDTEAGYFRTTFMDARG